MDGFTRLGLRELEDVAPRFGLAEVQEARFATRALGTQNRGLSLQRLLPGKRQSFGHRHERDEEIYVVVGGSGRAMLGDETVELRVWDAPRVAPATMRCLEAGKDGLEYLVFGAPASGTDDVHADPGWWGD